MFESIPGRTTGEMFAESVAEFVNKGDEITDIQFVQF